MNLLGRLRQWLRGLIPDVPADNEACEFGCHVGVRSFGRWESCERRVKWKRLHERMDARDRHEAAEWGEPPPAAASGE